MITLAYLARDPNGKRIGADTHESLLQLFIFDSWQSIRYKRNQKRKIKNVNLKIVTIRPIRKQNP